MQVRVFLDEWPRDSTMRSVGHIQIPDVPDRPSTLCTIPLIGTKLLLEPNGSCDGDNWCVEGETGDRSCIFRCTSRWLADMRSFLLDERVVRKTEGMSCGHHISHSDFGDGIGG